jgi:hypothetical protein
MRVLNVVGGVAGDRVVISVVLEGNEYCGKPEPVLSLEESFDSDEDSLS